MKKKLTFTITIKAPRAAVWDAMLQQDTYRIWTAPFSEGSRYEGSWEKGQRIRFLGPDGGDGGSGGACGMVAQIADNRRHEFISIEHLGVIKDGVEDTSSEEARRWAPAFENYSFADAGGGTLLTIDMDVMPEYEEMFATMWPVALEKLRQICER